MNLQIKENLFKIALKLQLNGNITEREKYLKFLGFILDEHLT